MKRWCGPLVALLLLGIPAPAWAAGGSRVALLQDIRVDGPVAGDVVAVGGDVVLAPGARVDGHVVSIFGSVEAEPGARVEGQAVAVASLAGLSLQPVGRGAWRTVVGLRTLAFGLWLLAVNFVLLVIPGLAGRAAHHPGVLTLEAGGLGLLVLVTVFAFLVAALGLGSLAPPAVVAVVFAALLLKAVGLAALTARLGTCCLPPAALLPVTARASAALLLLLLLRLVPGLGPVLWSAVSVLSFGAGVVILASWHLSPAAVRVPAETGSQR